VSLAFLPLQSVQVYVLALSDRNKICLFDNNYVLLLQATDPPVGIMENDVQELANQGMRSLTVDKHKPYANVHLLTVWEG